MSRHVVLDHINDLDFIVLDRDDESQIKIWLEEHIKENYHLDYFDGYYAPPMPSVLQISFDLMRDAIMFKMAWHGKV